MARITANQRHAKMMRIDDAIFQSKIRKMAKRMKVDEFDFIKDQGSLYARDLGSIVPPLEAGNIPKFGRKSIGSRKDYLQGVSAIRSDMKVNFRMRSIGYLQHVEKVVGRRSNIRQNLTNKNGVTYLVDVDYINYSSVQEALDFHNRQRRADGRPKNSSRGGNDTRIGRWQARDRMWITPDIWASVEKALVRNIGKAKASFGKAMSQLDPKKAKNSPKWAKRHYGSVRGQGRVFRLKTGPRAIIRASAAGLHHLSHRKINYVKKNRLIAMEKRLFYITKNAAKKSGFKVS